MPYVTQDKRAKLNEIIDLMRQHGIKADGDLNYILFTYCKRFIKPSYNNYKNYLGELNECINEIRRRLLSPYEDLKIKENGDIN